MKPRVLTGQASLLWAVLGTTVGLGLALPTLPVTAWPLLTLILLVAANYLGYSQRIALRQSTIVLCGLTLLALLIAQRHGGLQDLARGWRTSLADRLSLARVPNIFPQQLWDDHPQRLFLHAPHSHNLRLSWTGSDKELPLQSLGDGLFRWDFDPRREPLPAADPGGLVGVRLDSDGDGSRTIWLRLNRNQARPGVLCGDPSSGLGAAVSECSDEVFVVDRNGNSRRYSVPDGPDACRFIPGGKLAVTCRYDRSLCAIDLVSGNITHRRSLEGLPENLAVSGDGQRLAVLCEGTKAQLLLFSLPNLEPEAVLELPAAGEFLCFGRDSREVVVSSRRSRCLLRIVGSSADPSRWALQGGLRKLARPATGLCSGPEGKIYFTSTSGQLRVGEQRGNHYVRHSLATLDLAQWYFTNVRTTESRTSLQQEPGCIDSGCDAQGLCLASGARLLMAFTGTHEVAAFPLQEGLETRVNLSHRGFYCPQGVADLGQGVTLVSYPAQGALVWLDQSFSVSRVLWAGLPDKELATQDSQAWLQRQGEIGFCEATKTGISCLSCHPGGDSDFACHDIGAGGMWGTLGCRGLAATGPFLRNGGYPDLADLHTTADIVYRGFRRSATVARPQALKAFLYALAGPVNPRQFTQDSERIEDERRGYRAFQKARCGECHTPPAFTNLASVTKSTLFPQIPEVKETSETPEITTAPTGEDNEFLKVPSLRGLWCSGPYLHDNRATTLEDVLTEHNRSNQHGDTASLSQSEKRDLVRFLESL